MRKAILSILIASIFLIGTTAWAGIYAPNGYTLSDAAYVGWADSVIDYTGYNASTVNNILGELDKTLAVGATQGGYITLGFDTAITNGSGADFVVWENGFEVSGSNGLVYAELGYVSVSTDGDNWVTFPSVYDDVASGNPNIDPTNVYNLAGNYVAYYTDVENYEGTPFDLDDLANTAEVLSGLVDLSDINFMRIDDIIGAGEGGTNYDEATYFGYASDHLIYDGGSYGGGADWNAVGVINAVPIPAAVWLLGSGLIGLVGIRRRLR